MMIKAFVTNALPKIGIVALLMVCAGGLTACSDPDLGSCGDPNKVRLT